MNNPCWRYHTKQMYEDALAVMQGRPLYWGDVLSMSVLQAVQIFVGDGLQEPHRRYREWIEGEIAKFLIWTTDVDKILEVYHTILDYELDPGDLIRGIAVTHHLLHENRQLHIAAAKVYIRRYTPYENGNEPVRRSFVANLVRLHNRQDLIPLYQADLAGIYGGFWGELEFLR